MRLFQDSSREDVRGVVLAGQGVVVGDEKVPGGYALVQWPRGNVELAPCRDLDFHNPEDDPAHHLANYCCADGEWKDCMRQARDGEDPRNHILHHACWWFGTLGDKDWLDIMTAYEGASGEGSGK